MKGFVRLLSFFVMVAALSASLPTTAQDSDLQIIRMNTATSKGVHFNPLWFSRSGSQWHTFPWLWPGLTFFNQNNEMKLHLATDVQINEDSTVYTFTLPEDAHWTDGEPLTSHDVKFSYELLSNPAIRDIGASFVLGQTIAGAKIAGYNEFAAGEADGISGIETPDDHTVVFNLEAPNGVFMRSAYVYIMPEHVLGDVPIEELPNQEYMDNPTVTSGTLKFVEYILDDHMEFDVWKEGWWPTIPAYDKIIFFQSNQEASLNRLETGEEDLHVYGTVADRDRFVDNPEIESAVVQGVGVWGLHVNQRQEIMQDVRVRQAVAHAIDKATIIDFMTQNTAEPINSSIFGPDWAVSPNLTSYEYNPELARSLFEEAGWDFENNVIRFLGEQNDLMALYVQQSLADIGVTVELVSTAGGSLVDIYNNGEFEMGVIGGGSLGADPSVAAEYFLCGSDRSRWDGYCNPRFDELAAEGLTSANIEDRGPIYQEMSEILATDLPWIPLYKLPVSYLYNVRLKGFVPAAALDSITWNLPQWYLED